MTTKDDARKSRATKKRANGASGRPKGGDAQQANGGLTGKQVLALWELVLKGDGTIASKRSIKLNQSEVKELERARLVTLESGKRRKNDPSYGAKLYLTDAGWAWANRQGLTTRLSRTKAAVPLFEVFLAKIHNYLEVHGLALDHLLRPRRADAEHDGAGAAAVAQPAGPAPNEPASSALEERIRAAYLQATGGALNEYVRLALLRDHLRDMPVEVVDAELIAMQRRGSAVLYPIDDPQRRLPEDDAAALRVSGERRDLLCIKG